MTDPHKKAEEDRREKRRKRQEEDREILARLGGVRKHGR
jgi:hypothetical protein